MKHRCAWVGNSPIYQTYHDEEWGIPVKDDDKMFEFLLLETFQAGLSWITILNKRENFRKAFDQFDYKKIALYGNDKFEELISNPGIIRNKAKISSAINNAIQYQKVQEEHGSFCDYIWGFVNHKVVQNTFENPKEIPAKTELSDRISKDLKSKGFKFIGSTTIYAHLQATGIVNDHIKSCFRYSELNP